MWLKETPKKSELIKGDYEKLKGGVRDEGTISFETTPKPWTIPNNHIIIASRHNSQQPMVIPKLPIQFADFPNHLYSVSWESFKLRHLMRSSVRVAWKCKGEPVKARLSRHSLFMEPSFDWKQAKRLVFSEIPRVSHYNNNSTRVDCHAAWRRQGRPAKAAPLVKSKRKLLSNKGQLLRIAL